MKGTSVKAKLNFFTALAIIISFFGWGCSPEGFY